MGIRNENEAKNNAFNITWEKERAWEKINQLVNGKHSKAIVWYFAMAASVSLVVANTLHFIPDYINATLPYETEQPKISNTLYPFTFSILILQRIYYGQLSFLVNNQKYNYK